jgi:glucose/arabinose dehydrogenase
MKRTLSEILLPMLMALTLFACKPSSTREKYVDSAQTSTDGSLNVEVVAEGLYVPWSIVFTGPNRILLTERNGKLRQIANGTLDSKAVKVFGDVSADGEQGLMGLVLDPAYTSNKFLYVSYAYRTEDGMFAKVVRYTDNGSSLSDEKIIFDRIPAADNHAGCRLRFGPDGKLYVTTGDAKESESLLRILRTFMESFFALMQTVRSLPIIPFHIIPCGVTDIATRRASIGIPVRMCCTLPSMDRPVSMVPAAAMK